MRWNKFLKKKISWSTKQQEEKERKFKNKEKISSWLYISFLNFYPVSNPHPCLYLFPSLSLVSVFFFTFSNSFFVPISFFSYTSLLLQFGITFLSYYYFWRKCREGIKYTSVFLMPHCLVYQVKKWCKEKGGFFWNKNWNLLIFLGFKWLSPSTFLGLSQKDSNFNFGFGEKWIVLKWQTEQGLLFGWLRHWWVVDHWCRSFCQ